MGDDVEVTLGNPEVLLVVLFYPPEKRGSPGVWCQFPFPQQANQKMFRLNFILATALSMFESVREDPFNRIRVDKHIDRHPEGWFLFGGPMEQRHELGAVVQI